MVISHPILLGMRNASDNNCRENQNTLYCTIDNFLTFFPENRAVYELMWDSMVHSDRPQTTILRMRIACLIPKATIGMKSSRCVLVLYSHFMVESQQKL